MERLYVRSRPLHALLLALLTEELLTGADRLENEHLGNMDQYRITREVPLPYSFDELGHETDVGDEDDHAPVQGSVRASKSKQG
jgi:hypothetical protein